MKKVLVYLISIATIGAILIVPNYAYYNMSVASLKQALPVEEDNEEAVDTVAPTLPSFLESSVGVHTGQDIGIVGKLDPTIPNTKISDYIKESLENDSEIYDIELSEEVKQNLIGKVEGNMELEDNITSNKTNPMGEDVTSNKEVDIEVIPTLKQFANR